MDRNAGLVHTLEHVRPSEMVDPGGWHVDSWIVSVARMAAEKRSVGQGGSYRIDTDTALFTQQLQHIMAQAYDRKYPGLKAREFVPIATGIHAGAEAVIQRGWDMSGEATLLAGEARDVNRVSLSGLEQAIPVIGFAIKWAMTMQQLEAASMAGVDLDNKGLLAATRIVERTIDSILSTGAAGFGVTGFATQPVKAWAAAGAGVETAVAAAPAGYTALWGNAAAAATIIADMAIAIQRFRANDTWMPTHVLMDPAVYTRIEGLNAGFGTDRTILEHFKALYPELQFHSWSRLTGLSTGAGTGRVIMYAKDTAVVEGVVSKEPIHLPPVWDGLGFETTCYARCGGIMAADTTGCLYLDM